MVHKQWWIFLSCSQETNEICDVLQMLPLSATSSFFSISHVSVSGFQAYGSLPQLSLETQLWPCLKHVILRASLRNHALLKGLIDYQQNHSASDCQPGWWIQRAVDIRRLHQPPAVQFPPHQRIGQYRFLSIGHWGERNGFSSPELPTGTDSCQHLQR